MKNTLRSLLFFTFTLITLSACQIVELAKEEEVIKKPEVLIADPKEKIVDDKELKVVYLPIDKVALVKVDGRINLAAATPAVSCGESIKPIGLSISFDGELLDFKIKAYAKNKKKSTQQDNDLICATVYTPPQVRIADIDDLVGRGVTIQWVDVGGKTQTGDLDAWAEEIAYPSYVAHKKVDLSHKFSGGGCFTDEDGYTVCEAMQFFDPKEETESLLTEMEALKFAKSISVNLGGTGFCREDGDCVESYEGNVELFLGENIDNSQKAILEGTGWKVEFRDVQMVVCTE